jgi:mRNA-degrading endonuclease toxin of MazEF toxin-antitoxin module
MRRGDIWTASGGHVYSGKPRPVVRSFDATASVALCAFATGQAREPRDAIAMHGSNKELGIKLVNKILKDLGLK